MHNNKGLPWTHVFDAVSSADHYLGEDLVTILPQLLPAAGVQLPGDAGHEPHGGRPGPQRPLQLLGCASTFPNTSVKKKSLRFVSCAYLFYFMFDPPVTSPSNRFLSPRNAILLHNCRVTFFCPLSACRLNSLDAKKLPGLWLQDRKLAAFLIVILAKHFYTELVSFLGGNQVFP